MGEHPQVPVPGADLSIQSHEEDFAFRRPVDSLMMHSVGQSVVRNRSRATLNNFLDVYSKSNNKTAFFLFLMVSLDSTVLQQSRAWEPCGVLPGVAMACVFGAIMIMLARCIIDLPRL